jgi:hypothetical protein
VAVSENGLNDILLSHSFSDCDKGLFHDSTSNSCKECPIGKYKDRNGHHECTDCPEEHTTLSKGSVSDTQCIRGKFAVFFDPKRRRKEVFLLSQWTKLPYSLHFKKI